MTKLFTQLFCFALIGSVSAQNITNVTISPTNPSVCDQVTLTVNGTHPGNAMLTGFTPGQMGSTVTIEIQGSGSGGGTTPFSQPVGPIGPYSPAGTFTFVVSLNLNGTITDTETITVNVGPAVDPNAGVNTTITICDTQPPFQLITMLNGNPDPGGMWELNGQPVGAQFIPGTSPAGNYVYFFNPLAPCNPSDATLGITYAPNGNPGMDGIASACIGGPTVDLFTHLNGTPQLNGTWSGPGNPNHSGMFNPATDPPGAYMYTVPGIGMCDDPSATVMVTINPIPNAGTGILAQICNEDSTFALADALTGNPQQTGTWYQDGFAYGPYPTEIVPLDSFTVSGTYVYIVTDALCGTSDTAYAEIEISAFACTIGIEEGGLGLSRFELRPNPARGTVQLDIASASALSTTKMEVLDISGRIVDSATLRSAGSFTYTRSLDISAFKPGTYVVRLSTDQGTATRKLVVE